MARPAGHTRSGSRSVDEGRVSYRDPVVVLQSSANDPTTDGLGAPRGPGDTVKPYQVVALVGLLAVIAYIAWIIRSYRKGRKGD